MHALTLALGLLATPTWTARLAPLGDTVARAPRFEAWLDGVQRLAAAVEADPAGRPLVESARAIARGPFAFDPFDAAAWRERGARLDAPAWFAQRGGQPVAAVVPAGPGVARQLAPDAPVVRVGDVAALRLPGLLVAERDGHVVIAADEGTLRRVLGAPGGSPSERLCPPSDGARLVVLGASPGRTVAEGVAGCSTVRLEPGRVVAEMRATGAAAAGVGLLLARAPAPVAPPVSAGGALAHVRLRLAPSAAGLLKLHLVRHGLHRVPLLRALADQLDGDVTLLLHPGGDVTAALAVREPARVAERLRAAGDPLPAEALGPARRIGWHLAAGPLRGWIHGSFAVLSTRPRAAAGAAAASAVDAAAAWIEVRPAAVPPALLEELLAAAPAVRPWAPLLRRLERFTLSVATGDVLEVKLELSGY